MFINGLLKEVELGVDLSKIGGLLFADDFVSVSNSEAKAYQYAYAYCCKWMLRANVNKSAVVVLARDLVKV